MAQRVGKTVLAVEVGDLARIFAWIYGAFGCLSAITQLLFFKTESITFPVGFFFAFTHLTFNFNLPTPTFPLKAGLAVVGIIFVYAISGAITGTILGWMFNLAAKYTGGIETKLLVLEPEPSMPTVGASSLS